MVELASRVLSCREFQRIVDLYKKEIFSQFVFGLTINNLSLFVPFWFLLLV